MDTTVLLLVAALAGLLFLWLRFRRNRTEAEDAGGHASRTDALDTVAGWPPEATRVLTNPERRAHSLLTNALPDYIILAQVPVSRFIRVPTRNSYVMAIVTPEERPAAASITAVPRSLASAASPFLAGYLLSLSTFGWPLVAAGGLKIAYDLMLLAMFRRVRPPEEIAK